MWIKVRMWPTVSFALPTGESVKPQPINEDLFFDVEGSFDDVIAEAKARKCGLIALLQSSDDQQAGDIRCYGGISDGLTETLPSIQAAIDDVG